MNCKTISSLLVLSFCFVINLNAQGPILYGTCRTGGNGIAYHMVATDGFSHDTTISGGTIFQYFVANDSLAKVHDFDSSTGALPTGRLMEASDNKLYGVTATGGAYLAGVLYQFDPVLMVYTKLHDFDSIYVTGGLVQLGDKLYGMAEKNIYGGVIYSYNITTGVFTKEFTFQDTNGTSPHGDLTVFNNKLYGVTSGSEFYMPGDLGVIFQFDTATKAFTNLLTFDDTIYGAFPTGKITVANNGRLYCMTTIGGIFGGGTILEYNPDSNVVVKRYDFNMPNSNFTDGPTGSLLSASNGNLYGFADSDYNTTGLMFVYTPGTTEIAPQFGFNKTNINKPGANLIQASNNLLYCADSTVYSYDYTTDTYTLLKAFNDSIGSNPFDGLLEVYIPLTGIEDPKTKENLTIYPSPATDKIFISTNTFTQDALTASITDMTGRTLVTSFDIMAGKIAFDIHTLTSGMYFVQVKQGDTIYTGRFVKIH